MYCSQWLYNAPVSPESLHWSDDSLLVAATGSTVILLDPYNLQQRGHFTPPPGLKSNSVTNVGVSPTYTSFSLSFTFETFKEFTMQDSGWTARIRSICTSPRDPSKTQGCLLGLVQSDRRVLVYCFPKVMTSEMSLVVDLTTQLDDFIKETQTWIDTHRVTCELRLQGGAGGAPKEREPIPDRSTEQSKQLVKDYKLPEGLDLSLIPSLENNDSVRFRLDLPKVVLSLWLEVRSKVPEKELPGYRKGDQLCGIDRQIYEKVLEHTIKIYHAEMVKHNVERRYLEIRARTLIRKRAVVSYDPNIWKGKNFTPTKSVLSLIGQKPRTEIPAPSPTPSIMNSLDSVLSVRRTNQTFRVVTPYIGRKKRKITTPVKSSLRSHFEGVNTNPVYSRKLALLSAVVVDWSPTIMQENRTASLLTIGMASGHLVLCWFLPHHHGLTLGENFQFQTILPAMRSEISVLKWKEHKRGSEEQRILFLLVGDVSGEVKLWTFSPTLLLQGGHSICQADCRPVVCAHVETIYTEDSAQLLVCIGKTGGCFAVWKSPILRQEGLTFNQWAEKGQFYWKFQTHSFQTITGICSTSFFNLIITVGLDSKIKLWRIQQDELQEQSEISKSFENQPIYGVVSTPSGLMMSIVKDLGDRLSDVQKHKMAWKRVAHGSLDLIKLVDLDEETSWQQGVDHLKAIFKQKPQNLSQIAVDVGFFVKWSYMGSKDDKQDEKALVEKRKTTRIIQFLKVVFELLDEEDEMKIRAAVALYHTLKIIPDLQIDLDHIQKLELKLLVNFVRRVFGLPDHSLYLSEEVLMEFEGHTPLQRMKEFMARWILQFPKHHDDSVLKRAAIFYHDRVSTLGEKEDPVLMATKARIQCVGESLVLDRCYVTFLPIKKVAPWSCPCCSRSCYLPFLQIFKINNPICLFCGICLVQRN